MPLATFFKNLKIFKVATNTKGTSPSIRYNLKIEN